MSYQAAHRQFSFLILSNTPQDCYFPSSPSQAVIGRLFQGAASLFSEQTQLFSPRPHSRKTEILFWDTSARRKFPKITPAPMGGAQPWQSSCTVVGAAGIRPADTFPRLFIPVTPTLRRLVVFSGSSGVFLAFIFRPRPFQSFHPRGWEQCRSVWGASGDGSAGGGDSQGQGCSQLLLELRCSRGSCCCCLQSVFSSRTGVIPHSWFPPW